MQTPSAIAQPPPSVAEKSGGGRGHLTVNHRRVPSIHGPDDRHESAAWYEEDVENGWRVAYRLVAQRDAMVIAEIRILPADPHRRGTLGEWSGETAAVPSGGVTDAVLKALRTELPIERAREVFAHLTGGRGEEYPSLEFIQPMGRGRNGTPPRRRKPLPLLELAAAYAKHVANGHRSPVRATADELNYAPRYASKRIADARESGWLTPTSQRKASGVLTEEARSILARHPGDRQSPLA